MTSTKTGCGWRGPHIQQPVHEQSQSPLFALPPDLRIIIWRFAVLDGATAQHVVLDSGTTAGRPSFVRFPCVGYPDEVWLRTPGNINPQEQSWAVMAHARTNPSKDGHMGCPPLTWYEGAAPPPLSLRSPLGVLLSCWRAYLEVLPAVYSRVARLDHVSLGRLVAAGPASSPRCGLWRHLSDVEVSVRPGRDGRDRAKYGRDNGSRAAELAAWMRTCERLAERLAHGGARAGVEDGRARRLRLHVRFEVERGSADAARVLSRSLGPGSGWLAGCRLLSPGRRRRLLLRDQLPQDAAAAGEEKTEEEKTEEEKVGAETQREEAGPPSSSNGNEDDDDNYDFEVSVNSLEMDEPESVEEVDDGAGGTIRLRQRREPPWVYGVYELCSDGLDALDRITEKYAGLVPVGEGEPLLHIW